MKSKEIEAENRKAKEA